MKQSAIKKLIIIIIITIIVIGIVIGVILLNKEEPGEIIDKPLGEVTKKDFLKIDVQINLSGFGYEGYEFDYKDIYKHYVKPNYANIKVEANNEEKSNLISFQDENFDSIQNNELLDLRTFMEHSEFGFLEGKENNVNEFLIEYLVRFNEDRIIYAIPEYINIPATIYNSDFVESFDVELPDTWSELAILKGELMRFKDYEDHIVAGYDRDSFDIVKCFVSQGYDEETARYIVNSWENKKILKGYDQTNEQELATDAPIMFIMPNPETIKLLGGQSSQYAISGMLLDDDGELHVSVNDGVHGNYMSIVKGDNVYEDIASWLYLKESIDVKEYYEPLTLKPYLEDNLTSNLKGKANADFILPLIRLLEIYNQMSDKGQVIFYK